MDDKEKKPRKFSLCAGEILAYMLIIFILAIVAMLLTKGLLMVYCLLFG